MSTAVVECRALAAYRLWVRFSDGSEGIADLAFLRKDEEGNPRLEPEAFAQAAVNPTSRSVVWPGGIDVEPSLLRRLAIGHTGEPRPTQPPRGPSQALRAGAIILLLVLGTLGLMHPGLRWAIGLVALCMVIVAFITHRRSSLPGLCHKCGYVLTGSEPNSMGDVRCPECGTYAPR